MKEITGIPDIATTQQMSRLRQVTMPSILPAPGEAFAYNTKGIFGDKKSV